MAFSELLQLAGNCGRYQITLVFSSLSLIILVATHNLVQNFSAAIPAHRCYVHLLDNITSQSKHPENLTAKALLRMSIPRDNHQQEQCRRFRQTQWQLLNSSDLAINTTELETEPCLDGWTYDQSLFTSTIVTQWDLVCESQSLKLLSQSIYMAGYMLGSSMGGYITDKFGRKPALLVSPLLVAILGTGSIYVPTFSIYCIIRFLMAMALGNIYNNTLVILIEWLPTNAIPMVITAMSLVLSTGQVLLAGLAYVFRDWRMLQLSISVPYFAFFLFQWWSLESARWLIVSGKLEKALEVLKKVAHINGKKDVEENLHIEIFCNFFPLRSDDRFTKLREQCVLVSGSPWSRGFSIKMSLSAGDEVPATATFHIPVVRLGLAALGKGCMAMYFNMSMTYNHELIPTGIRSKAEGVILFITGLGASLGSLVSITRQYFEPLPMILCGTFPVVASICVYFLPETLNLPLPDTIQDIERRYKNCKNTSTKEEEISGLQDSTEC
ncbi:solute carrier family 22 member 12-like [Molossus molossus]|uniref:solute carrier family 22 member 12-like n=1 Tax=Molossus molossus TaxID=27622 RepID=UPI001747B694|nr:solute carrier family 22 member 12-like [Molossus molossus]